MKNNKTQLLKERDCYYNTASRQSLEHKSETRLFIILSISLIIILLIPLVIQFYLSSQLKIAQFNFNAKAKFLEDLSKEIGIKDKQCNNKKADIDDLGVSFMLCQTSFNEKEATLKQNKNQKEDLIKKLNEMKQGKIGDDNPSSLIITKRQKNQIEEWTNGSFGHLCYRDSRDGNSPQVFHKNCDKLKATITIIATGNKQIIGGFTSRNWDKSLFKFDNNAFLFSFNTNKIYPIKPNCLAIHSNPDILPSFGISDINLSPSEKSISENLISFRGDSRRYELNNGEKELNIREIEVFEIITNKSK